MAPLAATIYAATASLIAVVVIGATAWMILSGVVVPEYWVALVALVAGHWLGAGTSATLLAANVSPKS